MLNSQKILKQEVGLRTFRTAAQGEYFRYIKH